MSSVVAAFLRDTHRQPRGTLDDTCVRPSATGARNTAAGIFREARAASRFGSHARGPPTSELRDPGQTTAFRVKPCPLSRQALPCPYPAGNDDTGCMPPSHSGAASIEETAPVDPAADCWPPQWPDCRPVFASSSALCRGVLRGQRCLLRPRSGGTNLIGDGSGPPHIMSRAGASAGGHRPEGSS
jgi:hypothetical protein